MLWKEIFTEPSASRLGWVGRIATAILVLGVIGLTLCSFMVAIIHPSTYNPTGQYFSFALTIGVLLACGGLLMAASRAAGSITSEKERDCWTSLISTPLEPSEIVWAKIAGAIWSIRGLVLLLLLIWGLGVVLMPRFLVAILFMLATFLLLAFFASALGVMYSLRCRNSLWAMAATLATGLFVGGGYMLCCMPLMIGGRSGLDALFMFTPCIPFLLALPGIACMEIEQFFRNDEGAVMLIAYIIGNIGYCFISVMLTVGSIGAFDRLVGRTGLSTSPPRSNATITAMLVEESSSESITGGD